MNLNQYFCNSEQVFLMSSTVTSSWTDYIKPKYGTPNLAVIPGVPPKTITWQVHFLTEYYNDFFVAVLHYNEKLRTNEWVRVISNKWVDLELPGVLLI